MKKSLEAFIKGIIDYAGLFPPAKLPLDRAIRNYAQYRKEEDAWMLSRFIIPANRLTELDPYSEELFDGGSHSPFDFSVLGKGTETVGAFEDEIESVIHSCKRFNNQHQKKVTTDILEIKLPKEAVFSSDSAMVKRLLDWTAHEMDKWEAMPGYVFYEACLEESWKNDLNIVTKALWQHNKSFKSTNGYYQYAGFKLRCGGTEAHMFPSPEQVAFALNKAREFDMAAKCTAGLHHPLRHYDDSVQTKMHGFINVFGGAMLAYAHDLTDEEFTDILNEEDPEQFSFTDKAFSWKGRSISTPDIAELREVALISYGSCSFEEPREALQKLKLL